MQQLLDKQAEERSTNGSSRVAEFVMPAAWPMFESEREPQQKPVPLRRPRRALSPDDQRLASRHVVRNALDYVVETPDGELGFVDEVRIAPFDYWPEELIVAAPGGSPVRVPVAAVAYALPRQKRLFLSSTPPGAWPVPLPPQRWLSRSRMWRAAAAVGAFLGVGGYVATFAALVLDAAVAWAPGLTAGGAAGGALSAASWQKHGRSWPAAAGLASFWLPLGAGAILTLVLIFG